MSGSAKRKHISPKKRQEVWEKYNGHCAYCGCEITLKEMQVDHAEAIYPHEKEYKAGQADYLDSIENYMPACRMCNFYKSTSTIEGFRKNLQTLTDRLEKLFIYRLAKKYGIVKEYDKQIIFYFEKTENQKQITAAEIKIKDKLLQYKTELEKQTQYKSGLPGSALDIINTLLDDLEKEEKDNIICGLKGRLSDYQEQLEILARNHQMIIAQDALDMIEQLQDDIEEGKRKNKP